MKRLSEIWKSFTKEERLQMKLWISILCFLFLLLLIVGKRLTVLDEEFPEQIEETPILMPVITSYENVWVMGRTGDKLHCYINGIEMVFPLKVELMEAYTIEGAEFLADIELTNHEITGITPKEEIISGKVLGKTQNGVILEEYGEILFSETPIGLKIYKETEMCSAQDIPIGYDFTDFYLENEKIIAFVIAKDELMENIRVLIRTQNFADIYHDKVVMQSETPFYIKYQSEEGSVELFVDKGECLELSKNSDCFENGRVYISPTIQTGKITLSHVARNQGVPSYRGRLELLWTNEGIVIINELPLEEYLYSVVPSEMPASYPEEALKAQAICARTYAYIHMKNAGYPEFGAHVDDSTAYQVYNNIMEQTATTQAVKSTYGRFLYKADGTPAQTYYYSTSCGLGSDVSVWGTSDREAYSYMKPQFISELGMSYALTEQEHIGPETVAEEDFRDYILSVNSDDFEFEEPWYRWEMQLEDIDENAICKRLKNAYAANPYHVLTLSKKNEYICAPIKEFKWISDIYVEKRLAGGAIQELVIKTSGNTYKIVTGNTIRKVMNDNNATLLKQDGSTSPQLSLLPSAFFVVDFEKKNDKVVSLKLTGGGHGHGVGMSQNAAKSMAKKGYVAEEILKFFYNDCLIQ